MYMLLLSGLLALNCPPATAAEIETPLDTITGLNLGVVRMPVLSSDGSLLVYQGMDADRRVLAVIESTGMTRSFMIPDEPANVTVSADNKRIWFNIKADVHVIDMGTGKVDKVLTVQDPFDELFLTNKGEVYTLAKKSFSRKEVTGQLPPGVVTMDLIKLHKVDPAGKAVVLTRDMVSDFGQPRFLPTGEIVITASFISDDMTAGARDVSLIDLKGKRTQVTDLKQPCVLAALSEDGKQIAVTCQEHNQDVLHVADLTTKAAREVARFGDIVNIPTIAFAPDGKRLAFTIARNKVRFDDEGFMISLGGGGKAPTFASLPELNLIGFMDSGKTLVYQSESQLIQHNMVAAEPKAPMAPGFVAPVQENGRWTLIDNKGKQAFPYWLENASAVAVRNNLIVYSKSPLGQGYRDLTGKVTVPPLYTSVEPFSEGFGVVKKGEKCGFIDTKGKFTVEPQFLECRSVSEGLAIIKMTEDWGFVDMSSKLVYHGPWQSVESFHENRAEIKIGDRVGFADRTGNLMVPNYYDDASPFRGGYARIKLGDKIGFVDPDGKEIIRPALDKAGYFSEGLVPAIRGKNRGWLDAKGKWAIKSKSDWGWEFHDGLARFRQGDLFGYIDAEGAVVVEAKYKVAEDFSEGLAAVCADQGCGWIDTSGRLAFSDPTWTRTRSFSFGMAAFEKEGKWGYIDRHGKMAIEAQYESVEPFGKVR